MSAALRRFLALLTACALASAASAQPADEPEELLGPAPSESSAQPPAATTPAEQPAANAPGELPAANAPAELGKSRGFGEMPLELTADALDYDASRELYVARGDVVLRQGARTLRADWMAFNRRAGVGIANGNVEMREGDEILNAEFVQFQVSTLQGIVHAGQIDSPVGQFRASGEEIRKTGERSYTFKNAVFTTCRCPDPGPDPWRIRAGEADLEVGGYGIVKDATVDVLGIPVLWLPWLLVPLRTERQTGFLFPEIAVASRRGFEIGTPFFWAATDALNLTFTPIYSTRRGFKGDVSSEYVFGERSSGELFAALAYDQEINPDSLGEPFNRERWAALGKQDWSVPGDARFRTDFRFTSDNDYPIDFEDLRDYRADRWLQSWAVLTRPFGETGRVGAMGTAYYANDMQSPDDVDRDMSVLLRLPGLSFVALPGGVPQLPQIPWLVPAFDANYIEFQAMNSPGKATLGFIDTGPDGIFDNNEKAFPRPPAPQPSDPHGDNNPLNLENPGTNPSGGEGNGIFDEGEPLTNQGSKLDLYPRLGAPQTLGGFLELYPEIGWRQTLYRTEQGFDERGFFTGRVDLRTRLRRSFGNFTHVIEPTLGYVYVNPTSQSQNPLFQPRTALPQNRIRDFDLDLVSSDPADRITPSNRITWGAVQRLHDSGVGGKSLDAELALLASYDAEDRVFGWLIAQGHLVPPRYGSTRFHVAYDPEKTQLAEALFLWRWHHEVGHRVSIGYRYRRNIPNVFEDFKYGERFDNFSSLEHIQQAFGEFRLQVTPRWQLGYRTSYSFESDLLLQQSGFVEYLSKCNCWAAGLQLGMDRNSGVDVRLLYRLVGIGNDLGESPLLDSLEGL